MIEEFYLLLASLVISVILLLVTRYAIYKKMKNFAGTQKIVGFVTIIIIVSEAAYLGSSLGLFEFALEDQLNNIAAGIGIFFNSDINVGDSIIIKETQGVIIELHLTKIVALSEDGGRIIIPNQKMAEDFVIVYNKQRKF